jgi:hypothetical protein
MEMQQIHCYATGTVTLLWKYYRVHDHVTKENLICHNIVLLGQSYHTHITAVMDA